MRCRWGFEHDFIYTTFSRQLANGANGGASELCDIVNAPTRASLPDHPATLHIITDLHVLWKRCACAEDVFREDGDIVHVQIALSTALYPMMYRTSDDPDSDLVTCLGGDHICGASLIYPFLPPSANITLLRYLILTRKRASPFPT